MAPQAPLSSPAPHVRLIIALQVLQIRPSLDALGTRLQNQLAGKGASGAAKFTPRGTTYVFVNVVVAPRYVARVQPGSGGLKSLCGGGVPSSHPSLALLLSFFPFRTTLGTWN